MTITKDYSINTLFHKDTDKVVDGVLTISDASYKRLKYPHFAPTWDTKHEHAFTNPKPFKYVDRGLFADPKLESLYKHPNVKIDTITPKLGVTVEGIQLSKLTNQQRDDLALLTAQKGVVVFRNQDFKDQSFDDILKWGTHYGPLHVHPTAGAPEGQPYIHLPFRRGEKGEQARLFANSLNRLSFHSDVSYETQPPGITLLAMLQTGAGGDTQFIDTVEAYERLSPLMKEKLDGLKALHSSKEQADSSKAAGSIERKITIESIHPLVRYHPTLKKKCLYINPQFTRKILGLKSDESDNLLQFLIKHVTSCLDAHIRASWDERTVVIWDNRRLIHSASLDWDSDDIRHAFRVTPHAERPVGSKEESEAWTPEKEEENIRKTNYYLGLNPSEYYAKVYKK